MASFIFKIIYCNDNSRMKGPYLVRNLPFQCNSYLIKQWLMEMI